MTDTFARVWRAAVAVISGRLAPRPDQALETLIARRDGRLLADAGLSLPEAMGPWRYFRECELAQALSRRRAR